MKKRFIPILLLAFIVFAVLIILFVHFLSRNNDSTFNNSSISSSPSESYRNKEVISIEHFESKTDKLDKQSEALEKELERVTENQPSTKE